MFEHKLDSKGKCEICGGQMYSLPRDCPKRPLSDKERQFIRIGKIDYRAGIWKVMPAGRVAP